MKLKITRSTVAIGFGYLAGQEVTVPPELAARLIKEGYAIKMESGAILIENAESRKQKAAEKAVVKK